MKCVHCKSELVWSHVSLSVDRHSDHIAWESVPAWVCAQCGEALFEESELHHVQLALEQVDRKTKALASKAV